MKENSELLAGQMKSVGTQDGSRPTIELVTPRTRNDGEPIICGPNCIPNCQPVCGPNTRIPDPLICSPFAGLPRPPEPPGPPRPN